MRRKIAVVSAAALSAALVFSACGSGSEQSQAPQTSAESTKAEETAEPEVTEEAAEPEAVEEEAVEETEEALDEAVEEIEEEAEAEDEDDADEETAAEPEGENTAYAWLGMEAMPECDYMDAFASNHYIQDYVTYAMGYQTEETAAVDGVNSVTLSDSSRTYSIDGKVITINEGSKIYMEQDVSSLIDESRKHLESARKTGENIYGRAFVGTGEGVIPLYSEDGDDAEYEYYEFNYPAYEESGYKMVERYYMKDGDVFAIDTITSTSSDNEYESVKVIKSMSTDIPEGMFEFPDLTGYELYEI